MPIGLSKRIKYAYGRVEVGINFSIQASLLISVWSLVSIVFVMENLYKHTRLYINAPFVKSEEILLNSSHSHYLKNVLRKDTGDFLRVFNGVDGEWLARIDCLNKKNGSAMLAEKVKQQPSVRLPLLLFFSPIKKQRMDFLIEKAVELGVTGLYPVISNRTENRKLNEERIKAQIIEAAEQCERLDVPILHPSQKLSELLSVSSGALFSVPFLACLERNEDSSPISSFSYDKGGAFLIGPEGGFDISEVNGLKSNENIGLVSLGDSILRAETAAVACLSYAQMVNS